MRNAPNPDGKNHVYWIGLQLARNGAGGVTGASWTDGTPMDFGNPVTGRGQDPWAIGEPVNGKIYEKRNFDEFFLLAGNCVRMMNYGPFRGKWYDADCNQNTNLVPTQGYFCKGCPTGWTYFQGHCYRVFVRVKQWKIDIFRHSLQMHEWEAWPISPVFVRFTMPKWCQSTVRQKMTWF